ncbi:hypothetical protein BMS3Abin03_01831 [bacterium BMS3Abin03]|nr:hypothetical protein BMS3Abin03_01831 [bacterium BMS3Abin03]
MPDTKSIAIACMSGSLKGVFAHGVLYGFEEEGFKADAYACCSSSTVPTTYAAIGEIRNQGFGNWNDSDDILSKPGTSMSDVVLHGIELYSPRVIEKLQDKDTSRLMIVCSYVNNAEAAKLTRGSSAVTLGRKLIIQGARHISEWRDKNLELHVFDTQSEIEDLKLNTDNYKEVVYATTRMLHGWHIPATINGKPYIDGSYTCLIPVIPLAERGYKNIIAIATEPGDIYEDFFSNKPIGKHVNESNVYWIKPDDDLKNLGVDFMKATKEGFERVFQYGIDKGKLFLSSQTNFLL